MSVYPVQYMPEEQLIHKALKTLMNALGPTETMRFLALPREKHIDAVERHRQWQETLNRDLFYDQIFETTAQMD